MLRKSNTLVATIAVALCWSGQSRIAVAAVAEKTVEGVTVKINTSRWQRSGVASPPRDWNDEGRENVFVLGFDVLKDGIALPEEKTLKDTEALKVVAINADGERLVGGKWTLPGLTGHYRIWTNLDPRWSPLTFEFILREPAAPADADGNFSDAIVWKDVPLPTEKDVVLDLKRELTTAHGARVWLDKAKIETMGHGQDKPLLLLTMRWQPPANLLDMGAKFNLDPGGGIEFGRRVVDDLDKPLQPYMNDSNWLRPGDSSAYTLICKEPSVGAKSVTVSVNFKGFAPSLKQEKWFRRIQVPVPADAVSLPPATEPVPPLATAEVGGVRAVLERIVTDTPRNFVGRMRLESKEAPPVAGGSRQWILRQLFLRDPDGKPVAGLGDMRLPTQTGYWQADNRPLSQGVEGYSILGVAPAPLPAKFSLEAQVEQRINRTFVVDIPDLPLPALGEMLTIDRDITIEKIGKLTVRGIAAFDEKHSPSPRIASTVARGTLKPAAGLAILLQMAPENLPPAQNDQFFLGSRMLRTMSFSDTGTQDDTGTKLWRSTAWAQSDLDELTGKFPSGNISYKTVYLLPPAPQAKKFALRLEGLWTVAEQQQKLFLRDIDLPAPLPKP